MKKLFSLILVLGLLFGGVASAKITILECKYVGGFVNVKGKKEYVTRKEMEAFQKSDFNMDQVFKIDTRKEEIFTLDGHKFYSVKDFTNDFYKKWDDSQIFWSGSSQPHGWYHTHRLSRLTGKLVESTYQKSDLKKQLREGAYNCQEATKKF